MGEVFTILTSEIFRSVVVALGVIVAVVSVYTARVIARKKQAADLLFACRSDMNLQEGHLALRAYHITDDLNIRALSASPKKDSPEAVAIRYVLNHFELVSIGIQSGIYDESMIKRSWNSMIRMTYKRARPLIEAVREGQDQGTAWKEFEWLYNRWHAKKSPA